MKSSVSSDPTFLLELSSAEAAVLYNLIMPTPKQGAVDRLCASVLEALADFVMESGEHDGQTPLFVSKTILPLKEATAMEETYKDLL